MATLLTWDSTVEFSWFLRKVSFFDVNIDFARLGKGFRRWSNEVDLSIQSSTLKLNAGKSNAALQS